MTKTAAGAVRVRGLRKGYGDVTSLCGIDLDIQRGEVFALLGPNGAGKTTAIEIIAGYRQRTSAGTLPAFTPRHSMPSTRWRPLACRARPPRARASCPADSAGASMWHSA
jgi:ABC-type transporter Mla maintaining outer membrane lipid asymmetry ATPase subunit MlaF